MAEVDDWTIFPRKGLGRLEFGMSPAQVDILSSIYGRITGRGADRASDELLRDTLEKFGDAMSEAEKQDLITFYAESGPPADSVTETRGEPGLILRYQADRLVEIMPAVGQGPLILDGHDLLSLGAMDALVLLEQLNGGPGRYASTEATFDALAISLEGFCVSEPDAGVDMLGEADERFQGRAVTLRAEPYLPADEMHRFITHWVLS